VASVLLTYCTRGPRTSRAIADQRTRVQPTATRGAKQLTQNNLITRFTTTVSNIERTIDHTRQPGRGVRDVGVDEVIERAGVAKATLYRHFPSKDDLVVAFLAEREQRWTVDWVEAEARGRGSEPEQQLLVIFDLFDEWFHREVFEGCAFINVMLEMGPPSPGRKRKRASSREDPRDGSSACRGGRASRFALVRRLLAHPDVGVDRASRRGRSRRRDASQIDGPAADRDPPLAPCEVTSARRAGHRKSSQRSYERRDTRK
jgi:AcrR family transcriptional regulator